MLTLSTLLSQCSEHEYLLCFDLLPRPLFRESHCRRYLIECELIQHTILQIFCAQIVSRILRLVLYYSVNKKFQGFLTPQMNHLIQLQQAKMLKIKICIFVLMLFLKCYSLPKSREPEKIIINLDLPANQRYSQIAGIKQELIRAFIEDLQNTSQLYWISFKLARLFQILLPFWLQSQFYGECQSIGRSVGLPTSRIIVLNYMYELGAFHKFCTSIPVQVSSQSDQNSFFLVRNLDYDFQQFLAQNSVHFLYQKNGRILFQTFGHAGFVGSHTALRMLPGQGQKKAGYAISLNQRIEGGFHKTLWKIFMSKCQTAPYLLMKTLKSTSSVQQALKTLTQRNLCAPVYYILSSAGVNYIIERSRDGAKLTEQRRNRVYQNGRFFVHTNTDRNQEDPDGRRTVAEGKLENVWSEKGFIDTQDVWKVVTQSPNFNELTLMSMSMMNNGSTHAQIWR